ncbi:MAG: GDSL-type esterase/lipase family protein [Armatimonadetes bacterium]|nr:GDSL-type esterase/lipase family protein [Armatimonadota bacterium]
MENKLDETAIRANGAEAFELVLADGTLLKASDFRIIGKPVLESLKPHRNAANLACRYAGKQCEVKLVSADGGLVVDWRAVLRDGSNYLRHELTLTSKKGEIALKEIVLMNFGLSSGRTVGMVPGSPVVAGGFFFAYEHPLSRNTAENGLLRCSLERNSSFRPGHPLSQSSVVGVVTEGNLRRCFLYYLDRERAHPYRAFLHYNSWYDISRPDSLGHQMNEQECLDRIDSFGREMVVRRGVTFDSVVLDSGWDDFHNLWRVNEANFPHGFKPLRDHAALYKTHLGLWISPWGGYDAEKLERLKYGTEQGFETNNRGFSLAGPKYYSRFREVPMDAVKHSGVNYFKFDGIGAGSLDETESLMRLIVELRREAPNLFINTTTGTWPSPYWLWHGDSIWRGGNDMGQCGEGTDRERWLNYRDATAYSEIVSRAPLYPLNSLMYHGIINGEYSMYPLPPSGEDFVHEIRSYFGNGTGLQELYITPGRMTPESWNVLAEAASWSRQNADVLVDTHWVGGDPGKGEVYGWAAWSKRKAILTLRCPSSQPGKIDIDVRKVFELPAGTPLRYTLRSPWKKDAVKPPIVLTADKPYTFELRPFEVRVFDAYPDQRSLVQAAQSIPVLKAGERMVFLGDSITEQGMYTRYVMDYFALRYPGANITFRNAGRSSDTSLLGLKRLERDVLSQKPAVVSICFGMNDGRYEPFSKGNYDAYMTGMVGLVSELKKADVKVVLLTPGCVDPDRKPYNDTLALFADGTKDLAAKQRLPVYDIHKLMLDIYTQARAADPNYIIINGGVHPGPFGHMLMAYGLLSALGCISSASGLELDAAKAAILPGRCAVKDLKVTDDAIAFVRTDGALPTFYDDCFEITKYAPFLVDLNAYKFKVTGLKPGTWKVVVQGTEVGKFSSDALAAGVDLSNRPGPWKKLAERIHTLSNEQESLGYVRWWQVYMMGLPPEAKRETDALLKKMDSLIKSKEAARAKAVANRTWAWLLTLER